MRHRKPEDEFQAQVLKLAQLRGWKAAHFRGVRVQRKDGSCFYQTPVQADGAGWPDLVLVRGQRLVFAELKSAAGRLSPAQEAWQELLRGARQESYVWRPEHWPLIDEVLT